MADTEKNTKAHQSEGSVLEENPSEKKDDSSTAEGKASQNVLVEEMEARIQALEEEKKQAYDGFLRTSAEFENYKKRKDRETEDFKKFAIEQLIKELLPIIDNLERAISSSKEENVNNQGLIEGVDLILKEILKIFEKFKIKPIETKGELFDPAFHQAVLHQESAEHSEGTIVNELQKGYLLHDRLIRPAMVVVAKAPSEKGRSDSDEHEK